jgi:hypothetical protein
LYGNLQEETRTTGNKNVILFNQVNIWLFKKKEEIIEPDNNRTCQFAQKEFKEKGDYYHFTHIYWMGDKRN